MQRKRALLGVKKKQSILLVSLSRDFPKKENDLTCILMESCVTESNSIWLKYAIFVQVRNLMCTKNKNRDH